MHKIIRDALVEIVKELPAVKSHLSDLTCKAVGGYQGIRDAYFVAVYDAVQGYLESDRPVTHFSNVMREAMAMAFMDATYMGYEDAGAELPLDEDTSKWLSERIAQERGYIIDLFSRLKQEADPDIIHEANARAEGYTRTLDGIYQEAKMRGGKNVTLEFGGEDGAESCPDCQRLKGKRHKIQWIIDNDMIPRPGNTNFECQGYRCEHFWFNPVTGEEYRFQ